MKGLVFSIEEFAVHDGPGLRTTVFLKGCPLRCLWCHNPEGLEMKPQRIRNTNGCLHCGHCDSVCPQKSAECSACGRCAPYCPKGLIRIAGQWWEASSLAQHVKQLFPVPEVGGVTLTGGEVLMQPAFTAELLDNLLPLNRAIETSGYGDEHWFVEIIKRLEFVFMDVKHMNSARHRELTGYGNERIQQNLELLMESGIAFTIRVPTIKGINDDDENFLALADKLAGCETLQNVELLPYNSMAGAKYAMVGLEYKYSFQAPSAERLEQLANLLRSKGVSACYRKPI